uniref:TNFR-Cys domain-containing protein n=1 Tax=Cynoglossus semilaevis TaxID=244447 RepID=A0A3P8URV5_CYNSE
MTLMMLLLPVLCQVQADEPIKTFRFQDPVTGETLTCDKCQPGTFMAAPCTATTPTDCAPCSSQHFTARWNYLSRCLYCNNFCSDNQEVEVECSALNNRVCRCKEGFFSKNDFCIRHSECEPGFGVQINGTRKTDTVCEMCPYGYFSSSSSALDPCVEHTECKNGTVVLLPGSLYSDSVCGTCEELARGGDSLRNFISGFFAMYRMLFRYSVGYFFICSFPLRPPWVHRAPEEQLWKLPQLLKDAQLNTMATRLQKTLTEIKEQNPGCSLRSERLGIMG